MQLPIMHISQVMHQTQTVDLVQAKNDFSYTAPVKRSINVIYRLMNVPTWVTTCGIISRCCVAVPVLLFSSKRDGFAGRGVLSLRSINAKQIKDYSKHSWSETIA